VVATLARRTSVHLQWHACIRLCAGMQPAARAEGANAGSSGCIDVADRSRAWLELGGYIWLPLACVTTVVCHVQFVWVVRGHSVGHAGGVPSVMQVLRDSRFVAIGRLGQAWSGAHHTKSPMT